MAPVVVVGACATEGEEGVAYCAVEVVVHPEREVVVVVVVHKSAAVGDLADHRAGVLDESFLPVADHHHRVEEE